MIPYEHTVQRAIIMAAGKGERLRPLTQTMPKPLIPVGGIRMIDSILQGLQSNGIYEIHVVTGYLKEQFESWARDKDVHLIENPWYDTCNNISSLYVARDYLRDCIILDGDQLIRNQNVLRAGFIRSGYNAVWCENETREWLMQVRDDIVQQCSRTGGSHGWQLYSISRWSEEDGIRLRADLEQEFERGNRQLYWDDVPMFCHFSHYQLGITPMHAGDVIEIDGLDELAEIDHSYQSLWKASKLWEGLL